LALETLSAIEGVPVKLVESFVAERERDEWNDFCAIFRRESSSKPFPTDFLYEKVPCTNAVTWQSRDIRNEREATEDQVLLSREREFVADICRQRSVEQESWRLVHEELAESRDEMARRVTDLNAQLKARDDDVVEFREQITRFQAASQEQVELLLEQARNHEAELVACKSEIKSAKARIAHAEREAHRLAGQAERLAEALRENEIVCREQEQTLDWLRQVDEVMTASLSGWRLLMPPIWRRRRQLKWLHDKGLFNSTHYLKRYPDVARAGVDPLRHYMQYGLSEGRQIN
jgi:hypothetical protein